MHFLYIINVFYCIQILQTTIKERDQNIQDQAMLIARLSAKVENSEEVVTSLKDMMEKSEHSLKLETDKYDMKLRETQKYFEETLQESQDVIAKLRENVVVKDKELLTRENDLREIISRHEQDIQRIMAKGEVNLEDHVLKMLEQKLRDTNEVLEGKIKVIEVLQKEVSGKDKQIMESYDIQKRFKEKLQVASEQMMLMQANIVDMEMQYKEEKKKLDSKIRELIEKHETENTEKELSVQTMQSLLNQYQTAYKQAATQYNTLQEKFHQSIRPGGAVSVAQPQVESAPKLQAAEEIDATAQMMAELKDKLVEKDKALKELERYKSDWEEAKKEVEEKNKALKEIPALKMESEKLKSDLEERERSLKDMEELREEVKRLQCEVEEKGKEVEQARKAGGEGKGDAKMLKMKAQMTSKVKALEKELEGLKKVGIIQLIF